jgi:hypothetical protein
MSQQIIDDLNRANEEVDKTKERLVEAVLELDSIKEELKDDIDRADRCHRALERAKRPTPWFEYLPIPKRKDLTNSTNCDISVSQKQD